ncbi:Zn-dependent hydrolase of beta-lactamase [Histomonas meleagridis]|uniref:Zn-dependent hydrolase of beta-lactamase n=1 Tax=Histomonas meleagridis TaxID=135588 RepID=UPI003559D8B7|nr:Zn-dependent hydrolase of beta-lactamase [Histomonas meleagridis]KAH0796227.1 Zn-dependent hydrolase of beta-lactamase [Histomonas meleagridis]
MNMTPQLLPSYNQNHHTGFKFQNDPNPPKYESQNKVVSIKLWSRFVFAEYDVTVPLPVVNTKRYLTNDESIRVFWIGHSTCLIKIRDKYIITDPIFSNSCAPIRFILRRVTPVPFQINDLPKISVVLISHDHYDHLDVETLFKLKSHSPNMIVFAPIGVSNFISALLGIKCVTFDWRQRLSYKGIDFFCFPARHGSSRSMIDGNTRLWCSWLIRYNNISIYFPGDTSVGPHFKEIKNTIGTVHLAMMPIAPQEPVDTMKAVHLDPSDAYDMSLEIDAQKVFPIHYGTFPLGTKPQVDDIQLLKRVWKKNNLSILPVGGFMEWNGQEFVVGSFNE